MACRKGLVVMLVGVSPIDRSPRDQNLTKLQWEYSTRPENLTRATLVFQFVGVQYWVYALSKCALMRAPCTTLLTPEKLDLGSFDMVT